MERHLVLVGLMGTGKTTVGRRLATLLDRPLHDSDADVEARTGRSVREIWLSDGEARFRTLETEALADALGRHEPSVIAGAGGIVLAEANRALLSSPDVAVVWLRARPDTLVRRVGAVSSGHRPLLDDDPAGMLEKMDLDRRDLYASVADHVIDVDDLTPRAVADEIVRWMEASP